MRASKLSAATRRRRNALLEQRNRGLALTYDKRSCQKDMATHRRHLSQYLANARRRGLINPKDLKDL